MYLSIHILLMEVINMHFLKHTCIIALFLCVIPQIHGMNSNKRKRNDISGPRKAKHKQLVCAPWLPDDVLVEIFQEFFSQNPENANVLPCVSAQWNTVANSPAIIKGFNPLFANDVHYATLTGIRRARGCPPTPTAWSKLDGFKKSKEVNLKLWGQCYSNTALTEIEETLKDPYANVNYPTWHASSYPQTPLYAATETYNPELVELLLKHKADVVNQVPQLDHGLLFNSLCGDVPDGKIAAHVACLKHLLNAGAKDNGAALNSLAEKARKHPKYYELIPLFKETNANFETRTKYTALHKLLNPRIASEYDKEAVTILLTTFKANPHIKNHEGYTAYDFAETWGSKELMKLIDEHDSHKNLTIK